MKRYDIHFDDKDELRDYEDPKGQWVLWMDVYTLLARQGIVVRGFESKDVNPGDK